MKTLKTYVETHKDRFLDELFELLKIPSVSADSAYKKDVISTAKFGGESSWALIWGRIKQHGQNMMRPA